METSLRNPRLQYHRKSKNYLLSTICLIMIGGLSNYQLFGQPADVIHNAPVSFQIGGVEHTRIGDNTSITIDTQGTIQSGSDTRQGGLILAGDPDSNDVPLLIGGNRFFSNDGIHFMTAFQTPSFRWLEITGTNVYAGPNAGLDNTGSGNVFIGNEAGRTASGDNKLYIGNSDGTPLIYGEFDNNLLNLNGDVTFTGATNTFDGAVAFSGASNTFANAVAFDGNVSFNNALNTFNGSVEIGTNDLANTYNLSVNGPIKAREVEVTVLAEDWPDFVFDDNHKLAELDEVEQFIEKHHHLPDVPSQKQVHENGINLGEMDAILLKKIEELTLYVIALKKENEEIKKVLAERDND